MYMIINTWNNGDLGFDMKHLKKVEGHICRKVVSITIKIKKIIKIYLEIKINRLYFRNLDK